MFPRTVGSTSLQTLWEDRTQDGSGWRRVEWTERRWNDNPTILSIILRGLTFCSTGCNHLAGARSPLGPLRPRLVLPHKNQVSALDKALLFTSPLLEEIKNENCFREEMKMTMFQGVLGAIHRHLAAESKETQHGEKQIKKMDLIFNPSYCFFF